MYTEQELSRYDFFEVLLKTNKIEYLLDSLTGLLQRQYMIMYIKYLIKKKRPFTMAILDLDSFKQINDNHGHEIGDIVLKTIASSLKDYIGEKGIAARYGGDEFIFLYFASDDYDALHDFYEGMYRTGQVLRKNIKAGAIAPFVTGTIGSSNYPKDADNYEDLFKMSDKTLYRGKQKGRNCFIIYVKEKHENLIVQNIRPLDLFDAFINLERIFDSKDDVRQKIKASAQYLTSELRIHKILFLSNIDNKIYDLIEDQEIGVVSKIDDQKLLKALDSKTYFSSGTIDETVEFAPSLASALEPLGIQSILILKTAINNAIYGSIMYAEERGVRIWESQEKAILAILSRFIAEEFANKNK